MLRRLLLFLALATAGSSCARRPPAAIADDVAQPAFVGPDHVTLDILRTVEGGPKLFVQATLPDGERGLFLVDTGAAVSVLNKETAERLELDVAWNAGTVEGMSGSAPFHKGVLPSIDLGGMIVPDVEIAVDVRGAPTSAGAMPVDGILGNNVWARFTVEIDYRRNELHLHRPGTVKIPRRAQPLLLHEGHVLTPLEIRTGGEEAQSGTVVIAVDTGAVDLILSGSNGRPFAASATEGLEQMLGIGASEYLPPSVFLQRTRRIPIDRVELGGRRLDVDLEARWVNFEQGPSVGPQGLQGLIGHELLEDHVVLFDYPHGAFAMTKARGKARPMNGHQVLLEQDLARYGDDPSRYLYRARLQIWLDEVDAARELLDAYLEAHPTDAEARVLLARMRRVDSDLEGAWDAIAPLGPGELVDEHEIGAVVNGLLLDGEHDRALEVAKAAVAEKPEESQAHLALADVLLALGRPDEANEELLEAARLDKNPDAHLLRRARVALARGDHYAGLAHVRRLLQLYPAVGSFLWYYALVADGQSDLATFRQDMEDAIARLHPTHRPLDFMVGAHRAMGDVARARELMEEGIARDCTPMEDAPNRDNCHAWYWALAGVNLDPALQRIDGALAAKGDRSDFLDTKAVVHLARGEHEEAYRAAVAAARLAPEDIYMLWQAERIGAMARRASPTAASAGEEDPGGG